MTTADISLYLKNRQILQVLSGLDRHYNHNKNHCQNKWCSDVEKFYSTGV